MHDDNGLRLPPALEIFGADLALRMRALYTPQPATPSRRRRPWQLVKRHSRISAGVAFVALAAASAGLADAAGVLGTAQPTSPNTDQVAPLAQAPERELVFDSRASRGAELGAERRVPEQALDRRAQCIGIAGMDH